ncbi:uncharacterized protein VDAG_01144 [Verticillium dahliae VdLs.17]|uniref:CENP-V/GFA domain-containing protein n=2 Tax=Verticillium dahliae TaxID=27337 RepID=G2WTM1_VERDV|nr:uncharacterized protein VDAG_01144 [Verticillium dahliae VdLs.17]EGY17462.1 hypothetical protein VDAG_01144 [Verticillium dahliae VdLs.17]KAF3348525.1 Kinesin-like protein [Verticillium dahliae VDG2]KAH6665062.1 Mss4-like protein [Verticillium dahliae]KAH6691076.1 Mss4-like protein [Verticillium dahliae]
MPSTRSEDWKSNPPYARPRDEPFTNTLRGSCHCGQVVYHLSRDRPLASKYCHCTDCQTLHGAPFQWAAIFEKHHVAFDRGVEGLAFYSAADKEPAHGLPCKVSCARCGSRIMDEGRNMVLLFPALVEFEGDEEVKANFAPEMHIFYTRRVVDITDGKPKWAGLNDKSELVGETR